MQPRCNPNGGSLRSLAVHNGGAVAGERAAHGDQQIMTVTGGHALPITRRSQVQNPAPANTCPANTAPATTEALVDRFIDQGFARCGRQRPAANPADACQRICRRQPACRCLLLVGDSGGGSRDCLGVPAKASVDLGVVDTGGEDLQQDVARLRHRATGRPHFDVMTVSRPGRRHAVRRARGGSAARDRRAGRCARGCRPFPAPPRS